MKLTKKQKKLNKKLRYLKTKSYAKEQAKKELNKSLEQWKNTIRMLAGNKCEVCGKTGLLHPHHILLKERYPEFKTEIYNGILLCPACHKYGKLSAHMNGMWFSRWLWRSKPEQFEWIMSHL